MFGYAASISLEVQIPRSNQYTQVVLELHRYQLDESTE